MYVPVTSNSPEAFNATLPGMSPNVHLMCRCVDVSLTIMPALSLPHVPSASFPSAGGRLVVDEHATAVINTMTVADMADGWAGVGRIVLGMLHRLNHARTEAVIRRSGFVRFGNIASPALSSLRGAAKFCLPDYEELPVSYSILRRATLLASTVTSLAAAPVGLLSGQAVIDAKSAAHIRDAYLADLDTMHRKIVALANAIPADKYAWRPGPGVRSIAEVLTHVAGEWYFYTPNSVGARPPAGFTRASMTKLDSLKTKAEVLGELDKSWAYCKAAVSQADPSKLTGTYEPWKQSLAASAFVMSGDLHEHLGQLIAYARSVGTKPPWSK
jgi:uncharacterized damage-inducible protein DinB